jgi:hypothetical protein
MQNMYVITVSDKQNMLKTDVLKTSIDNLYKLVILDNYDSNLGNLSKIFKSYEYIQKSEHIKDNDIICIVDGHDIIYNKNKKGNLLDTFIEYKKDIIISCETKFSHQEESVKNFYDNLTTFKNKYINSGFIIAYKWAFIKMFGDIINNIHIYNIHISKSDQRVLSLYIKNNYNNISIGLDYNNKFCTTVNTEYNGNIENIDSFFIHVTFLKNKDQKLRYDNMIKIYN